MCESVLLRAFLACWGGEWRESIWDSFTFSLTGMLFLQISAWFLFQKGQNLKIRKSINSVFFQCPGRTLLTRPTHRLFRRYVAVLLDSDHCLLLIKSLSCIDVTCQFFSTEKIQTVLAC